MRRALKVLAALLPLVFAAETRAAEKIRLVPLLSVYTDDKGAGLKQPEGVACGDSPIVVVADSANGRLLRYSFLENKTIQGGEEIRLPEVAYPVRVQLNSRGEIFALDGRLHRIARIGPDGAFGGYVNPSEIPEPSAFFPVNFAIDRNDTLYILDVQGGRVLRVDAAGKAVGQIAFPEKFGFFLGLGVDPRGTVYIVDSVDSVVYSANRDAKVFSPLSKGLKDDMRFPADLAVEAGGALLLVDRNGDGVAVVGPDGLFRGRQLTFGRREGLLDYPAQICITARGDVLLADRGNNRVQVFSLIRE